ncbi:MAG: GDSL-type esterase/lipase family protein [Pirellulaceae bacterium]
MSFPTAPIFRSLAAGLVLLLGAFVGALWSVRPASAAEPKLETNLELKHGDHICLIGNTLAERMQHHGWLETLVQSHYPNLELTFRNLGYPADEVNNRPREQNFGDPDKHLTHSQADVIFAFFGYNEAQNGEAGLAAFRQELADFIDHTRAQKYNGQSAPRLVLFSPIAHEDLRTPNLPDGKENNQRLAMYTKAMAEVAKDKGVPFVDLFHATPPLYAAARKPLTIDGVHLTEAGDRAVAGVIDEALFGEAPTRFESQLEKLREAVLDKNLHWFNRYRVTDGYNVYGGRSGTGNYDGQTNFTISARELEIVDVKTANRDKKIWAIAQGGDLEVDDSNAPPPLTIKTNRPGSNPDGSYPFLSGEAAIEKMTVHTGMSVNLFASEEMFPELINPVQSSVDADGRLWVAAWPTYPHWDPANRIFTDKLLILPDDDGDGVADRCITFADHLHNPTGFEFWGGGVLVGQAPDILFLKDTDGDDKADLRLRVLNGIDSADTHHTANSYVIGTDGALYFQSGIFQVFGIESPWGKPFRDKGTGVYRFDPLTYETSFHFRVGPNPHGDVIDRWGNQFVSDGTSGTGYHIAFPGRGTPKQLYVKQYRPVPGLGMIEGSHFPKNLQGNLLIANAIGFQGVAQYEFANEGATFHVEPVEPVLFSSDPNFRPSSLRIGGDGALYITDWQNPLIGHLQHNLRDPNRDHKHGRVYRVTVDGRPLRSVAKMDDKPVAEVVEQLTSPDADVRYRARLELTGREAREATAAAAKLAESLDASKVENAQTLTETLWVHQMHKIASEPLLRKVLDSPDANARAAAVRVLRDWHGKIENVGPLLIQLAADSDARVRAEAVVAAVYYGGPDAAEVLFTAEQFPKDLQLDFNLTEARKSIDVQQYIKDVLASGRPLSDAAYAYTLRAANVAELMKLKPTEPVYLAILSRTNAKADQLNYAISGLAKIRKTSELELLLDLIAEQDAQGETAALAGAGELLLQQPGEALRGVRDRLQKFATGGESEVARRLGFAAWIAADGHGEDAFIAASNSADLLRDALSAASLVKDAKIRAGLYEQVRPLMFDLPSGVESGVASSSPSESGLRYDYFLPNPPNVALDTLAKLKPKFSGVAPTVTFDLPEIKQRDGFAMRLSGTVLIDRGGKYTFYLTSDDGSRLYIGGEEVINHDGKHGASEKAGDVELPPGAHPIVVTYFDNGGGDALSLAWKGPGIRKKQPVPTEKLSTGGGQTLHDVAISALASIPGRDTEKVRDLSAIVRSGRNRTSAIRVLRSIAVEKWPKKEVRPVVDALVAYLSQVPAKYRTGAEAGEAIGLTRSLAALLPAEQGRAVEARLENLDVRVIAISTVPERMIYDTERIVVEAGKPVEVRLSNPDQMPHNFALVLPGAMEEVGLLAEATAREADVIERQYVPVSDKILLHSNLLQPGDSQALSFEAPKQPGIYPYVCTYPGHWRRMYGAMVVVENLKEYEADAAGYLASHKLEIKDKLLALIGQSHEWTLEELAGFVKPLEPGRSFAVGKNAFTVSSCVACHKIGKEGQEIGPDLSKMKPENHNPQYILQSLLKPSEKIEEKYQSQIFALDSGKIITGMVLEETPEKVVIVDNPLAKTKPIEIAVDSIEERVKSPKSIMPEGLLSKLKREEILDLIAYVLAGGDEKHMLFHMHQHEH